MKVARAEKSAFSKKDRCPASSIRNSYFGTPNEADGDSTFYSHFSSREAVS